MKPSSLLPVIARLKQSVSFQTSLPASQVKLLYREPGVESGYRPSGKPWRYYILSAIQVNNETINIWSHLIAAIVFALKFFILHDSIDGSADSWPHKTFGICTIAYASLSSLAHTFHSKSPQLHYLCFQIDYLGIGLYCIGSNILCVYTTCPDEVYMKLRPYAFASIVPLAWLYVIGCCLAKLKYRRPYPPQRKIIQLVSGAVSVLPAMLVLASRLGSCLADPDCFMDTFSHHGRWMTPFVLCLFFFSSHMPEKLYPGKFDIVGQGHQLFHVLVAVATILQHEAGHIDLLDESMSHAKLDDVNMASVAKLLGVYLLGCAAIIGLLKPMVNERVLSDLKLE